jgi:biopolymer transport protein ExbD
MIFRRNRSYWFLVFSLALTIVACLYILQGIDDEERWEKERIYSLSCLTIPAEDEFYFGKDKIRLADVSLKLKLLEKELGTDYVLHIRTPKWVRFRLIMEAIQIAQTGGHTRFGLPTTHSNFRGQWNGVSDSEIAVSAQDCLPAGNNPEIKVEKIDDENVLLKLNSGATSLADITNDLKPLLEAAEGKIVCVKASGDLPYGRVAEVLHVAKQAGATNICMMIDKDKSVKK